MDSNANSQVFSSVVIHLILPFVCLTTYAAVVQYPLATLLVESKIIPSVTILNNL